MARSVSMVMSLTEAREKSRDAQDSRQNCQNTENTAEKSFTHKFPLINDHFSHIDPRDSSLDPDVLTVR